MLHDPQFTSVDYETFIGQEQAIPGWEQHFSKFDNAKYFGRVSSVSLGQFRLTREVVKGDGGNAFQINAGQVGICLALSVGNCLNNKVGPVHGGEGSVHRPEREYRVVVSGGSDHVVVQMPEGLIPEHDIAALEFIPRDVAADSVWWIAGIIERARAGKLGSAHETGLLTELLMDRIIGWAEQLTAKTREEVSARKARSVLASRSVDLLHDWPAEYLTVGHIATALGTDRTTLRKEFMRLTQMRLDDVLLSKRMSEARRQLVQGDPQVVSVSNVAMSLGFNHWGRFAALYKATFGETPSQSLRC